MRTWMLRRAFVALSPTLATPMTAQPKDLQAKVKEVFLQKLAQQEVAATKGADDFRKGFSTDTELRQDIKNKQIADYREMVWTAWREANHDFKEDKLIAPHALKAKEHGAWHLPAALEPNATMPFYFGSKKDAQSPAPLFVYLHGSGPKAQEWSIGLQLAQSFEDAPSMYFVPQIPNEGQWYRWWQRSKQYAWDALLRQALVRQDVNPRRLYVFGISEGGYGSQRLASFYADYLAAAGPMAGGEPLKNAPAENLSNIGFSLRTGAKDYGFYRERLTRYTREALDSLEHLYPAGYRHRVELIPERGHHIDYRPTTPWLAAFERNPWPKHFIWEDYEMDGQHRTGFYNLWIHTRPDSTLRTRYDLHIEDNEINISIENVAYTCTELDPKWGIELKFARTYTPATNGRLTLFLNEHLVKLTRPVIVKVNGRQVYNGRPRLSVQSLAQSAQVFGDPLRLFPVAVEVGY